MAGMAAEQLYQNRDLAITTDFRQVLGEAALRPWEPATWSWFSLGRN